MKQPDLFAEQPKPCDIKRPGQLVRIFANGYDVTDRMPLTRAVLEKMRADSVDERPSRA